MKVNRGSVIDPRNLAPITMNSHDGKMKSYRGKSMNSKRNVVQLNSLTSQIIQDAHA